MATKTTRKKKTAKTTETWQEAAARWRAEMDARATRDELAVVATVPNTPEGLYLRWRIASIGQKGDALKMRDGIPFETFYERLWRPFLSPMNTALWMLEGEDGLDVTQDDLLGAFRQTNAADWINLNKSLSCLIVTESDFASNDIPPEVEPSMRWIAYLTERASKVVQDYIDEHLEIAHTIAFFRKAERMAKKTGVDVTDPASVRQHLTEAMAEYSAERCKADGVEYKLVKIPKGEDVMLDAARTDGNELAAAAIYREHAKWLRNAMDYVAEEKARIEDQEDEILETAVGILEDRRNRSKGKRGRPYSAGKGVAITEGVNNKNVKIIDAARKNGWTVEAAILDTLKHQNVDPASYARRLRRWRNALCYRITDLPEVKYLINRGTVPDGQWEKIKAEILKLDL